MSSTIKETIKRYIILKITSGEWKSGEKILSENQLSEKWDCSRLTARNVLTELSYNGIIISKQGKGYYVNDEMNDSFVYSISNKYNFDKREMTIIDDKDFPLDKILEIVSFNKEITKMVKDGKYWKYTKDFYMDDSKIISQYTILNKKEIWQFDYDKIKDHFFNYIAHYGVEISRKKEFLIFDNFTLLKQEAKELNWKDGYVLHVAVIYSTTDWLELSLRVIKKEKFKYSVSSKI